MRAISAMRPALALALLFAGAAPAHEFVSTVTLAEGPSTLVSSGQGYVPAAGVRVRHCDIIQTGRGGLVHLETEDGGLIQLGPETRFLAHRPYRRGDPSAIGPQVVLAGWTKLSVPQRAKGIPHRINTPFFDLTVSAGVVVLQVGNKGARFFVETGEVVALAPGGQVPVPSESMYSRSATQARGEVSTRIEPDFLAAMPPTFRDTVPPQLRALDVVNVTPRPRAQYASQEVEDWLNGSVDLRPCVPR